MSSTIAARAAQKITARGPRTYLPWLGLFLALSGAYTYNTARKEGDTIDKARSRFRKAKEANDLRISHGAPIQHEDELSARLPETYHGIGDLGLWSDKKRFGIEKVPRHQPSLAGSST